MEVSLKMFARLSGRGEAGRTIGDDRDQDDDDRHQQEFTIFEDTAHHGLPVRCPARRMLPVAARTSVSGVEFLALAGPPTMRPSRITSTRSDMPRISGSSDETMMTLNPSPASSLMKACTAALEPMSMPLVGSSRMMTFGLVASHFADDDLLLVAARQRADGD